MLSVLYRAGLNIRMPARSFRVALCLPLHKPPITNRTSHRITVAQIAITPQTTGSRSTTAQARWRSTALVPAVRRRLYLGARHRGVRAC